MKKSQDEKLLKDAHRLLENPFWIQELKVNTPYTRTQDDHDGTWTGKVSVTFGPDGDAWVEVDKTDSLRFREPVIGGGRSPRVRNALMLLALAIKLDNEDCPEPVESS